MPILGYSYKAPNPATDAILGTTTGDGGCRYTFDDIATLMGTAHTYPPEAYGAVGDGVTDDTAAFTAAIAAAGATGGRIQGRTGAIYKVSFQGTATGNTLTTPYALWINELYGPITFDNCVFFLADGQPSNTIPLLIRGSGASKRTAKTIVRDCEFYSNPATQGAWTDFAMLEVAYADNVTMEGNYFHDSPFFGAQVFRSSQNSLFRSNRVVYSPYGNGYRIEITTGMVINNVFEGDPAILKTCLDLPCNADIAEQGAQIQVLGNLFKSGYILIGLAGQKGTIIQGNELRGATNSNSVAIAISHYSHGVNPYNCTDCQVVDNTIIGCRQGITISGSASQGVTGLIVENNQIVEDTGLVSLANGIIEDNRATVGKNMIRNNRIIGATTPFTMAGAPANGTRRGGNLAYNDSGTLIYCDENNGSGTIASGTTSIAITHGLGQAPQARNISVTPTANTTNDPGNMWISSITSTQFTVNCRADPGAGGLAFDWQAAIL